MSARWSPFEAVWVWYVGVVGAVAAVWGRAPLPFLAIHAALLVAVVVTPACVPERFRLRARGAGVLLGLPVAFTSLALVLPDVNPQPYEFTWIAFDRALLGTDPTVAVQRWLSPLATELLQWGYATFYFVPIAAIVGAWRSGGAPAFARGLGRVQLGFLLSYVGYVLWPTLPPYRFLDHGGPLEGVWAFDAVHGVLDALEANRWDCFPSGHTMLSVISAAIAWREARRVFWWLLPLVVVIVVSTVALRYHYAFDVIAGLLCVWPTLWLARRLYDPSSASAEQGPPVTAAEHADAGG